MVLETIDSAVRVRGRLLVLCAAVLWSTSGLFARAPVFDQWPLEQRGLLLAFWRAFFAGMVLVPLVRGPQWSPRMLPMLFAFVAMNVTYLTAMVWTTPANAIWLQNTAPVWVFLVGVYLLGETSRRADWWLLAFCASGVMFILAFEVRGESPGGVLLGLASGVCYAGIVLSLRQLRAVNSVWLVALNLLTTAAVLLPIMVFYGIWPHGWQWLYLAAFGAVQMGLPYVLFARGLRSIRGHEAAGIVLLEPLLVPVWVWLAYGDRPAWWTAVGGGLILSGLLVRYVAVGRRAAVRDSAVT